MPKLTVELLAKSVNAGRLLVIAFFYSETDFDILIFRSSQGLPQHSI